MTASSWLLNATHDKVLMIYHNIYHSWAWTGGHADGDRDLLAVAKREAMEETGVTEIRAISEDIFSLEFLTVDPGAEAWSLRAVASASECVVSSGDG